MAEVKSSAAGGSVLPVDVPEIPEWAVYSNAPIFANLRNMNGFDITIELPRVFAFADRGAKSMIGDRIYDEVSLALDGAGFHALDRLKVINSETRIGTVYDDDELGFEIRIDDDGDLRLIRQGSSFERFHSWYVQLMPSIEGLVSRILQGLSEVSTLKYSPGSGQAGTMLDSSEVAVGRMRRVREVRPLRAQFGFQFVAFDFSLPPSRDVQRNFVVMRKLLGAMPHPDGRLRVDLAEEIDQRQAEQYGRLDYKVSMWSEDIGGWAREVFSVEAPGNRRFSTVWLNFSFIGETKVNPDGTRIPFRPSEFLKYYEIPYMKFLKQRALMSFLADLTKGMVFETTAGLLP